MGKSLKGRECGKGICQRKDGLYSARFVNKQGKRTVKCFSTLPEARNWLEDAKYADKHDNLYIPSDMTVDAWFQYFINDIKGNTIRPNTSRNYKERYNRNIKECIGRMLLSDVKPIHCQDVLNRMASSYAESTIYQTRITLYTMFEAAVENEITAVRMILTGRLAGVKSEAIRERLRDLYA